MNAAASDPGRMPPPPPRYFRWLVLVFISLAMFGNYYPYDAMGPVFDLLSTQLGYTDFQLGWLQGGYSLAAVLVLLIGGYIIDRWGTKRSIFFFGVICLLAAIVTALSERFAVMLTGRILLGVGAEPLIVAVTTALAKWFKGKELSFAFGINLAIARLGSVAADRSPTWARPLYENWQEPLMLAAAIASLCVIGAAVYWWLESRAEQRYQLAPHEPTEKLFSGEDLHYIRSGSGLGEGVRRIRNVLGRVYGFSKSYWYVVGLCVVFYSTVFPFRAFAIKYFIEAHGLSREVGGYLNSLLPFAAIIATPLFGILVDRVGRRSFFMMGGSLLLLPLFLMSVYLPAGREVSIWVPVLGAADVPLTLLIIVILLGIAFSLIPAVMWPSVAYIVEQSRLGTGYALMTLCQQVGMFFVPLGIGLLNDYFGAAPENPGGYTAGMWLFTVLSAFGLLFSFLLWKAETGPEAHGLETIRAGSPPQAGAPGAS